MSTLPENTCEDELRRLKIICANLEYDLEETRKWAVSCEQQLQHWRNGPEPPLKEATPAPAPAPAEQEQEQEAKQTDSEMLEELRNSYGSLSHDYNNLDKDYDELQKMYDDLKAEHDALLVALEN